MASDIYNATIPASLSISPTDSSSLHRHPFIFISINFNFQNIRFILYFAALQFLYLESFEMSFWRKMETIKWSEKVTNEEVFEHVGEKRTLINNILRRKTNQIGHILRRNYLLHDAIEGHMTEVKGLGRRITQLFDDFRNRRRYWQLKEDAEDRERCK